jgi:hypothetical protein
MIGEVVLCHPPDQFNVFGGIEGHRLGLPWPALLVRPVVCRELEDIGQLLHRILDRGGINRPVKTVVAKSILELCYCLRVTAEQQQVDVQHPLLGTGPINHLKAADDRYMGKAGANQSLPERVEVAGYLEVSQPSSGGGLEQDHQETHLAVEL